MFVGRAASDGVRIYTGGGDANAYAYDAETGATAWSFVTNMRESDYRRLIYGPWYDSLELLPGGLVLVSTVLDGFALDTETGDVRWALQGSYIFAPKVLLDPDLLVIDDWARTVSRIDTSNGEIRWTADIGVRALNTGAAVHDGIAWVHGTTGQLTAVDLETGSVKERLQVTATANCYSTPAVAGGMLVVGDQDGILHGLTVDS
jgi:outer membrane protein assembly factor BamB